MNKPSNYDTVEPKLKGVFENPKAGGYIMTIVEAVAGNSKAGAPMLTLSVDIAEGKFAGHYRNLSKKLSIDGYLKYYQLVNDENSPYFKGLITAIERSNPGFKFDFNEKKLLGCRIGASLREEEYLSKKSGLRTALRVAFLCSVSTVPELQPLPIKHLEGSTTAIPSKSVVEDDLPF